MEAAGPAEEAAAAGKKRCLVRLTRSVTAAARRYDERERNEGELEPAGGGEAASSQEAEPAAEENQARAKNGGTKKRKRMDTREVLKQMEAEGVDPLKMKMSDLIWRAQALERLKAKDDPAKKAPAQRRVVQEARNGDAQRVEPVAVAAPQVQVVDGRIVINEESLVISSHATEARNGEGYTRVEENVSKLNYHSYSNREKVDRWKPEETDRFYKALEQFGTDFGLIEHLFPGRTRRQVKAKYKIEERLNPRRLDDALNCMSRGPVYHQELVEMLMPQPQPQPADEVEDVLDGGGATMKPGNVPVEDEVLVEDVAAGEANVAAASDRKSGMDGDGGNEVVDGVAPAGEEQVNNGQGSAGVPEDNGPYVSTFPEPEENDLEPPDSPPVPMFSY